MATAPSYVEQQTIAREKSLIENLMDFFLRAHGDAAHTQDALRPALIYGFGRGHLVRDYRLPELYLQRAAALIIGFAAMLLWIVYAA